MINSDDEFGKKLGKEIPRYGSWVLGCGSKNFTGLSHGKLLLANVPFKK